MISVIAPGPRVELDLPETTPVARVERLPRGAGYDKRATLYHLVNLENGGDLTIQAYVKSKGLKIDLLIRAFERHYPARWGEYKIDHPELPWAKCEYCAKDFLPANGNQRFCSSACSRRKRVDESYFDGKRSQTAGLAEGVCQLCGGSPQRGLSSHHVIGKENDPDNASLVALCQGCHKIITMLGTRVFLDNPAAWEALITFAWLRKNGKQIDGMVGKELKVEVNVELSDNGK